MAACRAVTVVCVRGQELLGDDAIAIAETAAHPEALQATSMVLLMLTLCPQGVLQEEREQGEPTNSSAVTSEFS